MVLVMRYGFYLWLNLLLRSIPTKRNDLTLNDLALSAGYTDYQAAIGIAN